MIEDCSSLQECEVRLSQRVESATLLGQIALTREDVDLLGTLIREKLSPDVSTGTRFLRRQAPMCLACFLVWMGTTGYREGDYWSSVQESLEVELDANRQRRWGQLFLDFLRAHDLPRFEIEGGLTYVTPILSHGGVPDSCLGEFFERVVLPMVQRDLMDPTDPEEIIQELVFRREDNDERLEAERRRADLRRKARVLRKEAELRHQAVDVYDQIVDLWQLEENSTQLDELSDLPEDFEAFQDRKIRETQPTGRDIRALQQQQEHCQQVIASFTQRDRRVLARATEIERCVSEYPHVKEQLGQSDLLEAGEGEDCRTGSSPIKRPSLPAMARQVWRTASSTTPRRTGDEITRLETDRFSANGSPTGLGSAWCPAEDTFTESEASAVCSCTTRTGTDIDWRYRCVIMDTDDCWARPHRCCCLGGLVLAAKEDNDARRGRSIGKHSP